MALYRIKNSIVILSILFLSSCAASFKNLESSMVSYNNHVEVNSNIDVQYTYNIYNSTLNRKYARKEEKKGYRLVALSITNQSNDSITFQEDNFLVTSNGAKVYTADINTYLIKVRQYAGSFLLHGFWGPWSIQQTSVNGSNPETSVSLLPIGLAVGLVNTIIAGVANSNHKKEILELYLYGRSCAPGEKINAVVPLTLNDNKPLEFTYIEQ